MDYLVTLKPLEPFFFGGEQTFGKLGDKERGSYFAKSQLFPQQTALLGMLKKEILKKENLLTRKIKDEWVDKNLKEKATYFSGDEKFSLVNKEHNFGIIEKVGEIFLIDNHKEEYRVIKDIFDYDLTLDPPLLKNRKTKENYSAKKEITSKLFSSDFKKKIALNDVFETVVQVGNQKKRSEDAFFKKESLKLDGRFSFAYSVTTKEYDLRKLHNTIVHLGADNSKFLMQVVKEYTQKSLLLPDIGHNYTVLLSDSYMEEAMCDFAISSEISFSFIDKALFSKSERRYFFEKGSIFINPKENMLQNIRSYKNLNQIGYNKFKEKTI